MSRYRRRVPELFADRNDDVLTVGELARQVAGAIKRAFPSRVTVRGEASNVRKYERSGILYFDLKDDDAVVKGVMFRGAAAKLKFTPRDGQELVAVGEVGTYAKTGQVQLQTVKLEPVGEGALELARRELREKLEAEGLLDKSNKRPVPRYPRRIVIVSSKQAAGFRDMQKVLSRQRHLHVFVLPVAVQGGASAGQVAAAIDEMSGFAGRIDVVILGRGGGSAEDLWSFNDERVARAVAACRVPVVTGIGHETDWTIADLAADRWCHTPTAAAEAVIEHWVGARDQVSYAGTRLNSEVRRLVTDARRRVREVERHELFRRPGDLVDQRRQRLDDAAGRLIGSLDARARLAERRLRAVEERLIQQHPAARLKLVRSQLADRARRLDAAGRQTVAEARREVATRTEGLTRALETRQERGRLRLDALDKRLVRPGVAAERRDLARLGGDVEDEVRRLIAGKRQRLDALAARLRTLDPTAVLGRGFTLTRRADGSLVRSAAEVTAGERLVTETADGRVRSVAE